MKKYKSGLLFGTFDPLHEGHISLIRRAYDICEKIYICMDDNELITLKGRSASLPITERIKNIKSLRGVDLIGIESFKFPKDYWVKTFNPEVLIKGDDWVGKKWDGERLCKTIYLKHTKGIHSSNIEIR